MLLLFTLRQSEHRACGVALERASTSPYLLGFLTRLLRDSRSEGDLPSELCNDITKDFDRSAAREMVASGMGKGLTGERGDGLLSDDSSLEVVGGYKDFVRSMVSRLCVFWVARSCNCTLAKGGQSFL